MPILIALAVVLLVLAVRNRRRWPAPLAPLPLTSRSPAPAAAPALPRAVVIAPMAGPVPELDPLLRALAAQEYPAYDVIIVIEARREAEGGADEVARRMVARERQGLPARMRVVRAAPATATSQKCANLLAGLAAAPAEAEVVALVDADVLPHRHWLRDLVRGLDAAPEANGAAPDRPLVDRAARPVLAATGFRWYLPGSWPALARSVFSAAALGMMIDPRRTIAWGGSLAMRRRDLESLAIPAAWSRALSDDMAVTRAVRRAGGRVRFVPECVLPSFGRPTWKAFREFAVRQLVMLRWGSLRLWSEVLAFHLALAATQLGALLLALGIAEVPGPRIVDGVGFLLLAAPSAIAVAYARARYVALRSRPLHRVAGWDRHRYLHFALAPFLAWFVCGAALVAGFRREVTWCGVRYRFRTAGHPVKVMSRAAGAQDPAPAQA
jgi:hypothetical protein